MCKTITTVTKLNEIVLRCNLQIIAPEVYTYSPYGIDQKDIFIEVILKNKAGYLSGSASGLNSERVPVTTNFKLKLPKVHIIYTSKSITLDSE